ncbi:PD-(D/E)XK nuclease family protein [Patescibacteria group bacterium]|nr:PD-(D/E)XK nuclease family protein [Patescibacteria group bacterium]
MTTEWFKKKHGYEVGGEWMPRVTAITSVISRSYAFPGAAAYASWGIAVHEAVRTALIGKEARVEEYIAPAIAAFRAWTSSNNLKVAAEEMELKVWDEEAKYAGTVDLVGEIGGRRGIIDVKTALEMHKEYSLQTAAYLAAYNKNFSKQGETRWILRIDQYEECLGCGASRRQKGGKPVIRGEGPCSHRWGEAKGAVELMELEGHEEDLKAFFAAKELWEWQHREWLRNIPNYAGRPVQRTLLV